MGQYFMPVNLDKRQFVDPHDYGSGLKLMEHSWLENGLVNAILYLLRPGGNWHRNRIVWAGDYMDKGLFLKEFGKRAKDKTLYAFMDKSGANASGKITPRIPDGPVLRYLINHTLKEYVNLTHLPADADGWCIHPLPLLTCSGNGHGGGDFNGENAFVERWAGTELSASYEPPENMTEIHPDFIEN